MLSPQNLKLEILIEKDHILPQKKTCTLPRNYIISYNNYNNYVRLTIIIGSNIIVTNKPGGLDLTYVRYEQNTVI